MPPGDSPMLRRAASIALYHAELCECPVQVIRLVRILAADVPQLDECMCPMCVGIMASRFDLWIACHPRILDDFHQPGASAMYGPGEQRDDKLIGPHC